MKNSPAYQLIKEFYNVRETARSKVPLINHINEGLIILDELGASDEAKMAYCLHPMLQNDQDLLVNFTAVVAVIDAYVVALAMEYRSVANEYLSPRVDLLNPSVFLNNPNVFLKIRLSPLLEVNQMLIADKVQNRKDFVLHHKGTHPRSAELDVYFTQWLQRLEVSEAQYSQLCEIINART